MKKTLIILTILMSGCVSEPTRTVYVTDAHPRNEPRPVSVVSVFVEPPMEQPEPVAIEWAPPPMLVETIPPAPSAGAIWTGGYWVWEGDWIWAHGHWASPPRPGYQWVHPYYEHRDGLVIFINAFWMAPGKQFVVPERNRNISHAAVRPEAIHRERPIGPEGVFIPPPPGSRAGLIVPAPIGTSPAVVTGAQPIVNSGMRITNNSNNAAVNNQITNKTVNNNQVTNVTNITNVTIIAPASATASGQEFHSSVPSQAHIAAAMKPVSGMQAPEPASKQAIPAHVAGNPPAKLPAAVPAHPVTEKQKSETSGHHASEHTSEPHEPAQQMH